MLWNIIICNAMQYDILVIHLSLYIYIYICIEINYNNIIIHNIIIYDL